MEEKKEREKGMIYKKIEIKVHRKNQNNQRKERKKVRIDWGKDEERRQK